MHMYFNMFYFHMRILEHSSSSSFNSLNHENNAIREGKMIPGSHELTGQRRWSRLWSFYPDTNRNCKAMDTITYRF